jgi:hypothetical protein
LKEQAKKAVAAGLEAQSAGRYDEAIGFYRQAYDAVPHPELLFNLAQAYRLKGDPETALGMYQRYLAIEPKGRVAADARRWVAELEKSVAQRRADAAKADEARKIDDARKAEEARRAEETRKVEEARRAEEARQSETARAGARTDTRKSDASVQPARADGGKAAATTRTDVSAAAGRNDSRKTDASSGDAGRADARRAGAARSDTVRTGPGKGGARSGVGADAGAREEAGKPLRPAYAEGAVRRHSAGATQPVVSVELRNEGGGWSRRRYGLITAGAGGAVLVTGAVFGVLARSKRDSALAICGEDGHCDSADDTARANGLMTASRMRGNVATVLFAVGGAGVVAGVILMVTGREAPTRTTLAPVIAPSAIGLAWGRQF